MRRWMVWLLGLAFVWIILSRFADLQKLAETARQGVIGWILVAALLQVVYYLIYAGLYHSAFLTVGVYSRLREMVPLVLASVFVNVAAPSGGASGATLFAEDAARRGRPIARAAAGSLLVMAADYGAFAAILVVGLVYLSLQHDLQGYEIVGTVLLLAFVLGLSGILALGLAKPSLLHRLLEAVQRLVLAVSSRLRRPAPLPENWAERSISDFAAGAEAIASRPGDLARTLLIALAAYCVDLASLYAVVRAFRYPIEMGPLVAGFSIGILFWIISITPQGIGVVEGVMALVFTSLHMPGDVATTVALVFRGLSFWLPLGLGFIAFRRLGLFQPPHRPRSDDWKVQVASLLTAAMGVVNVLSAVTPGLMSRINVLRRHWPLEVRRGSHLTAALAGFALLLLAVGLSRRKRNAWVVALAVLAVSSVSLLVKGLDFEEAFLAAALGIWLFTLRPLFHARSDPPSVRQGLQALVWAFAFTLAYGATGFYLLDHHFKVTYGLGSALSQTVVMFTQFYDPGLEPLTGFARYFGYSIYAVGMATFGYALLMLIRPVLVRAPASPMERASARRIIEAHGKSPLARMALFDDKSYFFTPGGSVIAYVVMGRGAVALGDPIGPEQDVAPAIRGFRDHCVRNDWLPSFYQVPSDHLDVYHAEGFQSLRIGQEATVDLRDFTLEGRAAKHLRSTVNRLTKLGHRAVFYPAPLSQNLMKELRVVSDEWLALVYGSEKRFSVGWFEEDYIRNSPVMAVHTPEGWISAFANLIPEYQLSEITVDLMRHRRAAEGGTMDFLFVSLLEWAKGQGYDSFDLGLSSLAGVGERSGDPAVERVLHFIYEHINQFYNFKGLHAFKDKFDPQWSPRYLIVPSLASLPTILGSLIRADSGDGFLWGLFKS